MDAWQAASESSLHVSEHLCRAEDESCEDENAPEDQPVSAQFNQSEEGILFTESGKLAPASHKRKSLLKVTFVAIFRQSSYI